MTVVVVDELIKDDLELPGSEDEHSVEALAPKRLWVPRTSSASRDQAIFMDQPPPADPSA